MSKSERVEHTDEVARNALKELEEFIASNPDPRELKRALSVRMMIEGLSRTQIQTLLGVSLPFISKWKVRFALGGDRSLEISSSRV